MRRRWCVAQVRFIYSDAYSGTVQGIPLDPMRGWKILGFLVDEGLLDRDDISVPRRPAVRSLLRVHDHDYIDAVGYDTAVTEKIFGETISDVEARGMRFATPVRIGERPTDVVFRLRNSEGVALVSILDSVVSSASGG